VTSTYYKVQNLAEIIDMPIL